MSGIGVMYEYALMAATSGKGIERVVFGGASALWAAEYE